jgi:hypothetical protein
VLICAELCAELCDLQGVNIDADGQDRSTTSNSRYPHTKHNFAANDSSILTIVRDSFVKAFELYFETSNIETDHIVAMCFWYSHLILELHFWPLLNPDRLLYPSRRIAELISQLTITNPLLHHFAGLAAHVLTQLADFTETRASAAEALETLDNALSNLIPMHMDMSSCDALVRDAVSRKRSSISTLNSNDTRGPSPDMHGLEHLANAAVGGNNHSGADDAGDGGVAAAAEAAAKAAMGMGSGNLAHQQQQALKDWDPSLMSHEGYLLALSR